MDFTNCAQCGKAIESKGIQYRGRLFCSDECCEEFEVERADRGDPDSDDLADDDLAEEDFGAVDLDEGDHGYQGQDDDTSAEFDDEDDFKIR